MPLVNFTDLDFDQIKTSIKDYLRSNSNFTDYDFEGSNLSTIIDVLAYNTYITSYNANMVSNEVFIDSATLRENVVSLARNVGYVPRSYTSSRAVISFFVDTSTYSTQPTSLTLQKGLVCTSGSFNNKSYTFTIPQDVTVPVIDNIASFDNLTVYQGTYITNNFTVNSFDPDQRFILTNSKIDSSLIKVSVRSSINDTTAVTYTLSDTIFGVDGNSLVFFIQEIEDERYEIIFGDGIFGKALQEPNYIQVDYIVTDGEEANGISSLTYGGRLIDQDGRVVTSGVSLLTLDQQSYGGKSIESIESIKKYATRIYASKYRAVTSADYEALIPTVYPETESVSAFGGEELNPPQFGKVFISIKPYNGVFLSNAVKDNIKRDLKQYSVAGIIPEIIDLKYLYIEANSNIYYNTNQAPSADYVKSIASTNINSYSNSTELNKFGARFKYSKFLKIIDDSHQSITSNITTIVMRRDLRASLNSFAEYEICFGNRFHIKSMEGYNIKSSGFTVSNISGTVYMSDIPNSDGQTGTLFLFKLLSPTQTQIVRRSIGTVDYEKGEVKLNPINITSTMISRGSSIIEISTSPYSNDVIGLQDLYLVLDNNNVTLNMISDRISSGADISGSNYIVSSSYSNGLLVR